MRIRPMSEQTCERCGWGPDDVGEITHYVTDLIVADMCDGCQRYSDEEIARWLARQDRDGGE